MLKLPSWENSLSVGPIVSSKEEITSGHLMMKLGKFYQIPLKDTWQRHLVWGQDPSPGGLPWDLLRLGESPQVNGVSESLSVTMGTTVLASVQGCVKGGFPKKWQQQKTSQLHGHNWLWQAMYTGMRGVKPTAHTAPSLGVSTCTAVTHPTALQPRLLQVPFFSCSHRIEQ